MTSLGSRMNSTLSYCAVRLLVSVRSFFQAKTSSSGDALEIGRSAFSSERGGLPNHVENRRDRRLAINQNGKRRVVVIVRERDGNSVPAVFQSEGKALDFIKARVAKGSIVNADEAKSWDGLHGRFETRRINHEEAYSMDGACTNMAEEYFSRLRRAEIGHHHHVAGAYLLRYAQEASWREDHRRLSNGEQVNKVARLAMHKKTSPDFVGYWQRHVGG